MNDLSEKETNLILTGLRDGYYVAINDLIGAHNGFVKSVTDDEKRMPQFAVAVNTMKSCIDTLKQCSEFRQFELSMMGGSISGDK